MKILFLTHRLPYAANRGDRVRAHHLLKVLARRAEVHLFSLVHDREEASHAGDLRGAAASVTVAAVPRARNLARALPALPSGRPLTHLLLDAPGAHRDLAALVQAHRPDLVLAFCSGMARFALEPPLAGLPFVLDLVDVDSQKWADLAGRARGPMGWVYARESRALGRFEALAATRAFATLVVNGREACVLASLAPRARIEVVANGIDFVPLRPTAPPSGAARVVFCGMMNYQPNVEAACWLAREVWPLVRTRRPAACLAIVGANPTRAVRRLTALDSSIEVTGTVPDVRPYLWRSAVSVAPLLVARGIQNKVLEAVAAGLPAVVTQAVAEGLPSEVRGACRVAIAPATFAAAIVELLDMPADARRELAASADLAPLTWDRGLAPLHRILHDAVASPAVA